MPNIEIRPAHAWSDFVQCEEVQARVWQMQDQHDIVPGHLLITAHKNGGLLLGAFDRGRMVGFVFGFLGVEAANQSRRLKHCSHMLAVLPEYRGEGLGVALKMKQREFLLAQDLDLASWTFDPLQALNAWLNLSRLGAIARRYVPDAYGEMSDGLNTGLASDRFEVEWWLNAPRVVERIDQAVRGVDIHLAQTICKVRFDERGLPHLAEQAEFQDTLCTVEIPADINSLRSQDLPLAQSWRAQTRALFEKALSQHYVVIEFARWHDESRRARAAYLVTNDSAEFAPG